MNAPLRGVALKRQQRRATWQPVVWIASSLLAMTVVSLPASAQKDVRGELSAAMGDLKSETARKEKISGNAKRLKKELAVIQRELIVLADMIQEKEKNLSEIEERLATLEMEEAEKTSARALRERQLARTVAGLIRLSRTPKAAVIAMPGDYATTLRTARVLGITTEAVRAEAEALRIKLEEIAALQRQIALQREQAAAEHEALQEKRTALSARLRERNRMQAQLFNDERKAGERVAELSRRSASLRELLATIEAKRAETPRSAKAAGTLRPAANAQGRLRWPAPGEVIARFGAGPDGGKGLTIRTRKDASVIAPYDGQVVFTGPFLGYGRMVILRHGDGMHSLVAGLLRIDCKPGEFLLEGEPIGAMGTKNELYLELRKNNRPVDPLPWLRPS